MGDWFFLLLGVGSFLLFMALVHGASRLIARREGH